MTIDSRLYGAVLLTGVLALSGCGGAGADASAEQNPDSVARAAVRIINVEVTDVAPGGFTDYIRVTGETEAYYDVTVSAEETGAVREVVVPKGSRVSEGDTILVLDRSMLEAQLQEAVAGADLARETYNRQRQLWEEDSLGSEIAFITARSQSRIADARVEQLRTRLDGTIVYAPVNGVFEDQLVELGEMAVAGAPAIRVVSSSRVKVTAGVPERYAPFVEVGDAARITFDVFPDREFRGRISYVGASVDRGSRTFPVELVLANPAGVIKPHMVADLELTRLEATDVITVPQEVVLRTSTGYEVFVVVEENGEMYSRARVVTLGSSYNNRVVIESGLEPGDMLITLGAQLVDDGSRVSIVGRTRQSQESE